MKNVYEEIYFKVLDLDPTNCKALLNVAENMMQNRDVDGALEKVEKAMAMNPQAEERHQNEMYMFQYNGKGLHAEAHTG